MEDAVGQRLCGQKKDEKPAGMKIPVEFHQLSVPDNNIARSVETIQLTCHV